MVERWGFLIHRWWRLCSNHRNHNRTLLFPTMTCRKKLNIGFVFMSQKTEYDTLTLPRHLVSLPVFWWRFGCTLFKLIMLQPEYCSLSFECAFGNFCLSFFFCNSGTDMPVIKKLRNKFLNWYDFTANKYLPHKSVAGVICTCNWHRLVNLS